MAEMVYLKNKQGGNIIEVPASEYNDPKKWGDAEKELWEETVSEEERNQKAWEQAVADSKRHDKEVNKNEDLQEAGLVTADAPPRSASGNTEVTTAAPKGK